MNRRGLTLVDVLAAMTLFVVLGFFSVAATLNLDNARTRVKCASNLRQIGQAILLYSNDTRGSYPRTKYDAASADHPTAFTGVDSPDPFAPNCPQVNDVSAAFYLLLRTEDITSAVFICPASGKHADLFGGGTHTALDHSNFPSADVLGYSYANPYPNQVARAAGYRLRMGMPPDFAVAADINPGSDDLVKLTPASPAVDQRKGNSPNHSGDGQNILYADGHVEFQNNPFAGGNRDNIYTFGPGGGNGISGSPTGPDDSVLLPTVRTTAADAGAIAAPAVVEPAVLAPPPAATDFTTVFVIASGIFLLILLLALAAAIVSTRRRRAPPG